MNMVGSTASKAGFALLWRIQGRPRLQVIKPVSAWKLPSGVSYDERHDQFLDVLEETVDVNWRTQPQVTLAFLPAKQPVDVAFALPGMVQNGTISVLLLWAKTTEVLIKDAWGIALSDVLYRVKQYDIDPKGVSEPLTIRLDLEESQSTR